MNFWMKLDKESFSFEAYFSDFGPVESIDFCITLCSIQYKITEVYYTQDLNRT